MPEAERNAAIDRVIEELKREEEEERDRQAELESQRVVAQNQTGAFQRPGQPRPAVQPGAFTTWYFYNPMAVQQGKAAFQRQWGKRENVDNWQRGNVTVVAQDAQEEETSEPGTEEETAEGQDAGEEGVLPGPDTLHGRTEAGQRPVAGGGALPSGCHHERQAGHVALGGSIAEQAGGAVS